MFLKKQEASTIITKSNKLIEASFRLSVQEKRLMYLLITKINKSDEEFKEYIFPINEIKEFLGVTGERYYSELQIITRDLLSKVLTIKEENGTLQVNWLSSAKYFEKEGKLELCFSPKMKPYLLQIQPGFTQFVIENVISLKSFYSVRIYELLKQFEKLKTRTIAIEELKETLQTEKSYDLYSAFKQKIILVAQKEINSKTDISFEFEEIKDSRKVVAIKFTIINKPEIFPEPTNIPVKKVFVEPKRQEYKPKQELRNIGAEEKQPVNLESIAQILPRIALLFQNNC